MSENEAILGDGSAASESSFSQSSDLSSIVSDSPGALEIGAAPKDESQPPLVMHAKYFINDRQVTFKVERTLFRVHRYFLVRDSEYFRALLGGGDSEDLGDQEWGGAGGLDAEPICLDGEGVKSVDFERFLDILYPSDYGKSSLSSLDEWSSVLRLASMWGFRTVCALAVREVLPLASPVDRIVLGREHGISDWLLEAYVAICARTAALTVEEGRRLGIDDAMRISALRQDLRPFLGSISPEDIRRGVQRLFLPGAGAAAELAHRPPPTRVYPGEETAPELDTQGTARSAATAAWDGPGNIDEGAASQALREVTEMIQAMAADNCSREGIKSALVHPHIRAQVGEFDAPTIRQFAQYLADTVDDTVVEKYTRLVRYLESNIHSTVPDPATGGLVSRTQFFARCLLDRCMNMPISSKHPISAVPRRAMVNFLLATLPSHMFVDLLDRCLAYWVLHLEDANAEAICELVELLIPNSRSSGYDRSTKMGQLISTVSEATQKMGWRIACRGEQLRQQWG